MNIFVCPLSALQQTLQTSGARRMISLSAPGKSPVCPVQIDRGFLALEFNDITHPQDGLSEPKQSHIKTLIEFFRTWNQAEPMLVQCWMGISRSTAAALIGSAALYPQQDMMALAGRLRHVCPMATPNCLMIALADRELGLGNALVDGVGSIGRGAQAREGVPFALEPPLQPADGC